MKCDTTKKRSKLLRLGAFGLTMALSALVMWPSNPAASESAPTSGPAKNRVPLSQQGPAPETTATEVERPFDLRFDPGYDDAVPVPNLPPLSEIEALPISDGTDGIYSGMPETGLPVIHDPETGETTVLTNFAPASDSEGEGPVTGGGYRGADGAFEENSEVLSLFGTLNQITTQGSFPWRMNCKILQRYEDSTGASRWYVCSASMYDAETVLTAGHCVFRQDHGWAKEIWVLPGWDGNGTLNPMDSTMQNYGWARGTQFSSWTSWTQNADWDGDVGLIRVTRAVGMLTGWYGWSHSGDCASHQAKTYHEASYPAESCGQPGLHNGRDMYYWNGSIDNCPDNQLEITTPGGCFNAGWGGMSGSGLYYIDNSARFIHAVASTSDRSSWFRFCRQWESWVDFVNDVFIPESRGTVFDLQALDMNCEPATIAAGGSTTTLNHLAVNPTDGTDSGTYSFKVYLSTNDNISSSDTLLSTQSYAWNFDAMGLVRLGMVNVTIPADTPPGDYWIGVVYDSSTDGSFGNNDTDGWDAAPVTITCPAVPTPENVQATDGTECDFIDVQWDAAVGAVEYRVYRNGVAIGNWQIETDYQDTGVAPDVTYSYAVRARNECGTLSGLSFANPGSLCDRPDNDDCVNARVVSNGLYSYSNVFATTDGPLEPACQSCCGDDAIEADVWFSYYAAYTGRVDLDVCASAFDTKIAVYEGGCPGTGTLIGCNDDACGSRSALEFFTEAGETYLIRVGSPNGQSGTGTLSIGMVPNRVDDCLGIDSLAVLRINGATGVGADRIVARAHDSTINFSISKPPAGGNGKFVVHMNPGMPNAGSLSPLPAGLGDTCFPLLFTAGATPSAIWTNINKPNQIGVTNFFGNPQPDPARAPVTFYSGSFDFPIFSAWTIQGVILNPSASSPKNASVTNPVILDVLP